MKKLVNLNENYSIYEVGESRLYEIAEFVIKIYYEHHQSPIMKRALINKTKSMYQEELSYKKISQIYIAENHKHQMIGCIRVMKWDKICMLPIQKIFNIDPLKDISCNPQSSYWHVGRFAIDSYKNTSGMSLFKQLMMYAIYPIYQDNCGYMIAEADSKLLHVVNTLGINTVALNSGIHYLGSEAIPIYADKHGLSKYYDKYHHLYDSNKIASYLPKVV